MGLLSRDTLGGQVDGAFGAPESALDLRVCESVQSVGRERWNAVVERASRGSVFHRHEWIRAVESGFGYDACHLLVEKDGNLIGLFPNVLAPLDGAEQAPFRRLTSLDPGFGGPIITTDTDAALRTMLSTLDDLVAGRTIVHEIRALDSSYLRYNTLLQSHGYEPNRRRCRFLLHLSRGYDDLLSRMSRSRRKGVEKGRDNDCEVSETEITRDSIERFYRAYEDVMDRVGTTPFPFEFFEELLEMRDRLLLVTARVDGEYAGGVLEILDDEQSSVHGYLAAIPKQYYKHHASELLYDYVVRWGIDHGYDYYDLGSTKPDYDSGQFQYKEGFGGQVVPTLVWERGDGSAWDLFRRCRSLYLKHLG
ncbi:lipid II:glycine glycyltransferase FemX [Haloarcula marina]|uniref:lipid II:glycine glycyltransferase FemX n=1 Tax=Haloarcula marina TaxID=2961574 RepID=UPI0020B70295|nr:GNAT family N-acetyltransferase [Halomicroarcula marina]